MSNIPLAPARELEVPRLRDRVRERLRERLRLMHDGLRSEAAYVGWI